MSDDKAFVEWVAEKLISDSEKDDLREGIDSGGLKIFLQNSIRNYTALFCLESGGITFLKDVPQICDNIVQEVADRIKD